MSVGQAFCQLVHIFNHLPQMYCFESRSCCEDGTELNHPPPSASSVQRSQMCVTTLGGLDLAYLVSPEAVHHVVVKIQSLEQHLLP